MIDIQKTLEQLANKTPEQLLNMLKNATGKDAVTAHFQQAMNGYEVRDDITKLMLILGTLFDNLDSNYNVLVGGYQEFNDTLQEVTKMLTRYGYYRALDVRMLTESSNVSDMSASGDDTLRENVVWLHPDPNEVLPAGLPNEATGHIVSMFHFVNINKVKVQVAGYGYLHEDVMYTDNVHMTRKSVENGKTYCDLNTNKLYDYDENGDTEYTENTLVQITEYGHLLDDVLYRPGAVSDGNLYCDVFTGKLYTYNEGGTPNFTEYTEATISGFGYLHEDAMFTDSEHKTAMSVTDGKIYLDIASETLYNYNESGDPKFTENTSLNVAGYGRLTADPITENRFYLYIPVRLTDGKIYVDIPSGKLYDYNENGDPKFTERDPELVLNSAEQLILYRVEGRMHFDRRAYTDGRWSNWQDRSLLSATVLEDIYDYADNAATTKASEAKADAIGYVNTQVYEINSQLPEVIDTYARQAVVNLVNDAKQSVKDDLKTTYDPTDKNMDIFEYANNLLVPATADSAGIVKPGANLEMKDAEGTIGLTNNPEVQTLTAFTDVISKVRLKGQKVEVGSDVYAYGTNSAAFGEGDKGPGDHYFVKKFSIVNDPTNLPEDTRCYDIQETSQFTVSGNATPNGGWFSGWYEKVPHHPDESTPVLFDYVFVTPLTKPANGTVLYKLAVTPIDDNSTITEYDTAYEILGHDTEKTILYIVALGTNDLDKYHDAAYYKFNVAAGTESSTGGKNTLAIGSAAHAEGIGTIAKGEGQTVVGRFNEPVSDALFVVGAGEDDESRKNALVVTKDGNVLLDDTFVKSGKSQVKADTVGVILNNGTKPPIWASGNTYGEGKLVSHTPTGGDTSYYICTASEEFTSTIAPPSDNTNWRLAGITDLPPNRVYSIDGGCGLQNLPATGVSGTFICFAPLYSSAKKVIADNYRVCLFITVESTLSTSVLYYAFKKSKNPELVWHTMSDSSGSSVDTGALMPHGVLVNKSRLGIALNNGTEPPAWESGSTYTSGALVSYTPTGGEKNYYICAASEEFVSTTIPSEDAGNDGNWRTPMLSDLPPNKYYSVTADCGLTNFPLNAGGTFIYFAPRPNDDYDSFRVCLFISSTGKLYFAYKRKGYPELDWNGSGSGGTTTTPSSGATDAMAPNGTLVNSSQLGYRLNNGTEPPAWESGTTYHEGDFVSLDSVFYRCKAESTNNNPYADTTGKTDQIGDYWWKAKLSDLPPNKYYGVMADCGFTDLPGGKAGTFIYFAPLSGNYFKNFRVCLYITTDGDLYFAKKATNNPVLTWSTSGSGSGSSGSSTSVASDPSEDPTLSIRYGAPTGNIVLLGDSICHGVGSSDNNYEGAVVVSEDDMIFPFEFGEWDAEKTYSQDNYVAYNGKYYRRKTTMETPSTYTPDGDSSWEEVQLWSSSSTYLAGARVQFGRCLMECTADVETASSSAPSEDIINWTSVDTVPTWSAELPTVDGVKKGYKVGTTVKYKNRNKGVDYWYYYRCISPVDFDVASTDYPYRDTVHWVAERVPTWSSADTYTEDNYVLYNGCYYKCTGTVAPDNSDPFVDDTHWEPVWLGSTDNKFYYGNKRRNTGVNAWTSLFKQYIESHYRYCKTTPAWSSYNYYFKGDRVYNISGGARRYYTCVADVAIGGSSPASDNTHWATVSDTVMEPVNYPSLNPLLRVYVNGIGSWETHALALNIDNLLPFNTKYVIVNIGTNDRNADYGDLETYYGELFDAINEWADARTSNGVNIIAMSSIDFAVDSSEYAVNINMARANAILEKVCLEKGVPYVNLYSEFNAAIAASYITEREDYFAPDNVHPSDLGHKVIFGIVCKLLNF